MAFLALASQKSLLNLQKNFLQLQYTSIMNQVQAATAQMAAIKREHKDDTKYDESEDATYLYYEQLDEQLSSEKDSIDTQMTAIENEISSLKTLVNNNVKSSCTLNLASGS
ncbi:hypothetical protein J6I39_00215 [bacterium]|nr:hypothetical protein [bacterium]